MSISSHPGTASILRQIDESQLQEFYPKLLATGLSGPEIWDVWQAVEQDLDQFMVKVLDVEFARSLQPKIEVKVSELETAYHQLKSTTHIGDHEAMVRLGLSLSAWARSAYKQKQLFGSGGGDGFDQVADALQPEFDRCADELEWFFDRPAPDKAIVTREEIGDLLKK